MDKSNGQRPSDEDILRQEAAIQDEINKVPLIGPLEPIEFLMEEYGPQTTQYQQLKRFKDRTIRRVRGDGNCFYRAFSFELIIQLAQSPAEASKLVKKTRQAFQTVNFDKMATEDFLNDFEELIRDTAQQDRSLMADWLAREFSTNEHKSHAVVVVLRLITSAYLRINAEEYEPFISEDHYSSGNCSKIATFCQKQVECIGVESEQIHIIALASFIGATVCILYVDSRDSGDLLRFDLGSVVTLEMIYRPGHYDLLHKI